MTAARSDPPADDGVCAALLAAVRPEFQVEVLVPAADDPILGYARCVVPECDRPVKAGQLCSGHGLRWDRQGRPDLDGFIADPGPPLRVWKGLGRPTVSFAALPLQLRLELQYAVQCRCDERSARTPVELVRGAIHRALSARVHSILELSPSQWRRVCADYSTSRTENSRNTSCDAFLVYAHDAVETLRDGAGWEIEYQRDVWRLGKLTGVRIHPNRSGRRSHLRFDRIAQPWLRELGKRWVRHRLVSGTAASTVEVDTLALARFSTFLIAVGPDIDGLGALDRPLLERYLAWLHDRCGGSDQASVLAGRLHLFLQAIRRHGWDDTLPSSATFFTGDLPARRRQLTRHLAEYVMAQIEDPAALDQWPTPDGRLITMILIRCGMRVTDVCTLAFDCLIHDGQGAGYLRYRNHKMGREAAVPIDEEVEGAVRDQQRRVLERRPGGSPYLFPRVRSNADGRHPISSTSYRHTMNRWLLACEVHDEHGQPVHLTPHQWRHTFATRLINRDVPSEVIRVLLDHESLQMTARYAKLTDQTVRRQWETASKVNIRGERVELDPDGPVAQAQWAKTRYGMATQTLPNGYCGLPVQRSCPHANACLSCPVFLTGPEFLPQLREQREHTLTLIDVSKQNGQTRMVEMNTQVLTNLDRMITGVSTDTTATRE